MLVTSRSSREYEAFFALTAADFAGRILDCCAGASGFAAAARERGGRVAALDPAYRLSHDVLAHQARASTTEGARIVADNDDCFTWSRVLEWLRGAGHRVDLATVPYEFQRGASQMLTVERGGH